MRKLINAAFMFAVASTCILLMYGCSDTDKLKPLVITKKIIYHDPILEHDFSRPVFVIPPRYNPKGTNNPFMTAEEHSNADRRVAKIAKKNVINIPITTLTSARLSRLNLTSVVVNHTFAYAFFTVGNSSRCYKATIGDFVGKRGITIVDITPGQVHLSNGDTLING